MKELTRAEEQVMQILWQLENAFVKDIIQEMPEPKPAYNTVSTIVRILEQKGFVGHEAFGKTYQYHPLIGKNQYSRFYLNNFLSGYFSGSFERLVSFFAKENDLDIKDMDELMKHVKSDLTDEETSES
jgi:predicted transcriptional regulator